MSLYAVAPRDRNVSWLAQCSHDWRFKPIKYLCALNSRVLSESTSADTEIKYIDIGSVNSDGTWVVSEPMTFREAPSRARRILTDGDVLISTVRTYLRAIAHVEKVNDFLICSTGFAVLSAGKTVDSRFMAYWVRSKFFVEEVVSRSVGVSYPAINALDIGNLPFPVLPLSEQCAIAAFLDRITSKIDALIDKKKQLIELLQEKRSALISHAVTKGLDPSVPMKDSGVEWLGEIPVNWNIKRLKNLMICLDGKRIPLNAEERSTMQGDYPYWGANCVLDHVDKWLFDDDLVLLGEDGAPFFDRTKDVAFFVSGRIWVNNHAHVLKPYRDMDPRFLAKSLNVVDYKAFTNGSTRDKLTQSEMNTIPIPFPPILEQRSIATVLDKETTKIDALISMIRESIEQLKQYRVSMISSAVTGKIDVRQVVA